jgi:protein involved in polysaccharide export with SLBB domain
LSRVRAIVRAVFLLCVLGAGAAGMAEAQRPTAEQAREILRNRPDLVRQLRERIGASGLTPDQIRARLRAAGYPENMLDDYLSGADTTRKVQPNAGTFEAIRLLGIASVDELDSLEIASGIRDSVTMDSSLVAEDTLFDTLRPDSLARRDSLERNRRREREREPELELFGLNVFRTRTTQFEPSLAGPVDATYRLGPGDVLVLILTGDVEQAHTLEVNREGFIVVPQVGQIYVANLTLGELDDLLYTRLGRVYSGVRRGGGATTTFKVTVARLRRNQIFVVGEVARPGSYQISAAGTTLSALYAAGGPTPQGSFRRVLIRRGSALVDSVDLYDFLLEGNGRSDVRLQNGDVVFTPVHGPQVKVTGKVIRPAIYELKPGETLRDLLRAAGGFEAGALGQRVQIHRILSAEHREPGGRERVVIDLGADQFTDPLGPAFPMSAGDSVSVFAVSDRPRGFVTVRGNVWIDGPVGYNRGMRLSDAIRLAGGPKPDVYLGQILVSRLRSDSTRIQLRSAFRDSTGAIDQDLVLEDEDEIQVFSRTDFRPVRYVAITGAVRRPGRLPFREGMTLRDAVLLANGVTEDALLEEAEIARVPDERSEGRVAETIRVKLDSTFLFERDRDSLYLGPPGLAAPAAGAPTMLLKPYDNILILRQPDWELQRTVVITGQVRYPGRYALQTKTDKLSDLIDRVGGLTDEAYPTGVELYRSLNRAGRVGIDLPQVLKNPRHRDNLILVGGDSIFIPEYNPTVRVGGAVNSPVAVAYVPGRSVGYYIYSAGGYSRLADRGRTYVTQPNGKVESVNKRFLLPDSNPRPLAGAMVFVPERDPEDRRDYTAILGVAAQILASVVTIVVVSTR